MTLSIHSTRFWPLLLKTPTSYYVRLGDPSIHCLLTDICEKGGHDNTERGYLPTLRDELQKALSKEPEGPFEVVVSTQDHHPLNIV